MNEIILLGILLSLIFTEFTDLSPGGIIVPAYFAMYAYDWRRMAVTVVLAFLVMLLIRFLSGFMILYGRRRFAMYMIMGILLKFVFSYSPLTGLGASIGYLVPGLLGKDMERQGSFKTLLALFIVTLFIRLIYISFMR